MNRNLVREFITQASPSAIELVKGYGGRLSVISFHSLQEQGIVKQFNR